MQVSMGDGGSGGGEEVLVNFQELLDIVMKLENIYKNPCRRHWNEY